MYEPDTSLGLYTFPETPQVELFTIHNNGQFITCMKESCWSGGRVTIFMGILLLSIDHLLLLSINVMM